MGWFSRQKKASRPTVRVSSRSIKNKEAADKYLDKFLAPSLAYGGAKLRGLIPEKIAKLTIGAPIITEAQLAVIEELIRNHQAVPALEFVGEELKRITCREIWWFIPGAVVADGLYTWVAATSQGIHCASPDNENQSTLMGGWDAIFEMNLEIRETECCCLHLTHAKGVMTIAELSPRTRRSSLPIIKAIHDVIKQTVGASSDPRVPSGDGGARVIKFNTFEHLLDEKRWQEPQHATPEHCESPSQLRARKSQSAESVDDDNSLAHAVAYIMICMSMLNRKVSSKDPMVLMSALLDLGLAASDDAAKEHLLAAATLREEMDASGQWLAILESTVNDVPEWASYELRRRILDQILRLKPAKNDSGATWRQAFEMIEDAWADVNDAAATGPDGRADDSLGNTGATQAGDKAESGDDGDESTRRDERNYMSDDRPEAKVIYLGSDTPEEFVDVALDLLSGASPVRTSPREVFGWFGYAKRAVRTIDHVTSVMEAAKLEAFPPITEGSMDSPVLLRLRSRVTPGRYTIALGDEEDEYQDPDSWVSDDRPNVIVIPGHLDKAFVRAVRSVHATGRPKRVVIRDLLAWFGQQRRGPRVQATISHALAQARIEAFPDLASAHIDSKVELTLMSGVDAGTFDVEGATAGSRRARARVQHGPEEIPPSDEDQAEEAGSDEADNRELQWLTAGEGAAWLVDLARFLRMQNERAMAVGIRAYVEGQGVGVEKTLVKIIKAEDEDQAGQEWERAHAWIAMLSSEGGDIGPFWIVVAGNNAEPADGAVFGGMQRKNRLYIKSFVSSQGIAFSGIGRSEQVGPKDEDISVVLFELPVQVLVAAAKLAIAPIILATARDMEDPELAAMIGLSDEIFRVQGPEALLEWVQSRGDG